MPFGLSPPATTPMHPASLRVGLVPQRPGPGGRWARTGGDVSPLPHPHPVGHCLISRGSEWGQAGHAGWARALGGGAVRGSGALSQIRLVSEMTGGSGGRSSPFPARAWEHDAGGSALPWAAFPSRPGAEEHTASQAGRAWQSVLQEEQKHTDPRAGQGPRGPQRRCPAEVVLNRLCVWG